jgi:acetyl-CoA carboxylase carboxyl transferase subunit alpha
MNSAGGNGGGLLEFERPLAKVEQEITDLEARQVSTGEDQSRSIRRLRSELASMTKRTYAKLTPWQTVQVARHPQRPLVTDYIRSIFGDFCELHGDRQFRDDPALMTGFARIGGHKVLLIGQNKGKNTTERLSTNFGMVHPEGYRKALAKAKLAAKYSLPVVCLIDTAGAFPGVGAEERGISGAIAVNLLEFSRLPTPVVCVVIGEGGSGGALGIGVGDRTAMFEHAYYSVISPEGCAAILFKTGDQAQAAAEKLKLTSASLKKLGVIDDVIPEPLGGAHRNPAEASARLERYLTDTIRDLSRTRTETLLARRYERLRRMGSYFERATTATEKKPHVTKGAAANGRRSNDRRANGVTVVSATRQAKTRRPVTPAKPK